MDDYGRTFYKKMDFLSFLTKAKVRYSYGEVGSDHGASRFTYLTQYSSGSNATFGDDKAYNDYILYLKVGLQMRMQHGKRHVSKT